MRWGFAAVLRQRDFRWVWAGQSVSALGDQLFVVAVAALVIEAGHGASGLGIVLAGRLLALSAFAIAGGVVSDRMARTRVMQAADALRIVAVAALALSPGDAPIWLLAALTFAVGGGEAFFAPAYRALLPSVVRDDMLEQANAITAVSRQAASVAGPALAGVAIATVDVHLALWADAGSFAISLATLFAVSERGRARAGERAPSLRDEVAEGIAAVRERPWIGLVIAMASLHLLFAIAPWIVLLPVVASDELGGVDVYGWLLAVVGVGSIAGGFVAARWRPPLPGAVALLALLPSGAALLVLVGPAPLAVVVVAVLLTGAGETIFEVFWTTGIQREVPDRLLGRVFAVDYVGSLALMPVGLGLTGPAVEAIGRDGVLVVGFAVVVATTLPLLALDSVRRFATQPPSATRPPA